MKNIHFKVETADKIAKVFLNRPEKANALNMEAWAEMQTIFETLSQSEDVRVIILAGEGIHFCAGIDLELLMSISRLQDISCSGRKSEKVREMVLTLQRTVSAIENCSKPVLAAIHG